MLVATALLVSALSLGTPQDPVPPVNAPAAPSDLQQRISTGVVLSASVEGTVTIFESQGRLVVQLDKPAGRLLEVALEPGAYELRLGPASPKVVRFQIGEGDKFVLEMPRADVPGPPLAPPEPPPAPAPPPALPRDPRHRIELRFGGWANGWSDGPYDWDYGGSAYGAFGVEYLHWLRNDFALGLALTTYGRADDWGYDWNDQGTAQGVVAIPIVVRWYPARRLTTFRAVEPYVTAGVGPVFGFTSAWVDCGTRCGPDWRDWRNWDNWDDWDRGASHTRASTSFGGRIGGGVDFRLGSVFTLGVAGAWNWNTGFPDDLWYRPDLKGGEFTLTFGWQFGR